MTTATPRPYHRRKRREAFHQDAVLTRVRQRAIDLGLRREAKPGRCSCLRCGKMWHSSDVRGFRICPDCKRAACMEALHRQERADV
jgi:hypothetical protein